MGPLGCPETSVINYHYSLRNNPEERSSRVLRDRSLKSRFCNSEYENTPQSTQSNKNVFITKILTLEPASHNLDFTSVPKQTS
jgi:hypothetical protein